VVELLPGDWTVGVTAWKGEARAAVGSAAVTVKPGETAEATVVLLPYAGEGAARGTLSYAVDFPPWFEGGTLALADPEGVAAVETVDLLEEGRDAGTLDLDPGSYLLRIRMTAGGLAAGRTEALHIYPGMTTLADYAFTEADLALPAKASIADSRINGSLYDPLEQTITVTLGEGETFNKVYNAGIDVSSWFMNDLAGRGLAAKISKTIIKNGTKVDITISGVAAKELGEEPLGIAIPAGYLTNGTGVRTVESAGAVIGISGPAAPPQDATPIGTAAELASIGADGGLPLSGSYYLTGDIDLSSYAQWSPIGKYQGYDLNYTYDPFTGVLDGQGHKITGLKLPNAPPTWVTSAGPGSPTKQHSALFTYISGAYIKNLAIELAPDYAMTIPGASYHEFRIAALAGFVDGGENGTVIAGVAVTAPIKLVYNASYYDSQLQIGGLFAYSNSNHSNKPIIVTACRAEVDFDVTSKAATWAGGLGGISLVPDVSIMLSQVSGRITAVTPETIYPLTDHNYGGLNQYYGGFICRFGGGKLTSNTTAVDITATNILPYKDTQASSLPDGIPPTNPRIRMGGFGAWVENSTVQDCFASGNITYTINTLGDPPYEEYVDNFIGYKEYKVTIISPSAGSGTINRSIVEY
jgi:hypothetical protein